MAHPLQQMLFAATRRRATRIEKKSPSRACAVLLTIAVAALGCNAENDGVTAQAEKKSDMYWRLLRWICSGQGLVDWCALAPDTVAALATCKEEGFEIVPPQEFERMRPDGKVAKWLLGSAKHMALPFLIEDITDRQIRVPQVATENHGNGATGILGIIMAADIRAEYQTVYKWTSAKRAA